MNLSQRDKRAIVLGAWSLGVILLMYFIVLPWFASWGDARDRIDRSRTQLDNLKRDLDSLLRKQRHLQESYGPSVLKPIEDAATVKVTFQGTIAKVLKQGGITYESISPRPARTMRDIPGVQLLPFQIKGKCKVDQLAKFLGEMRKSESLMILDRFTVSGIQKKKGQLDLSMTIATLGKGKPKQGKKR